MLLHGPAIALFHRRTPEGVELTETYYPKMQLHALRAYFHLYALRGAGSAGAGALDYLDDAMYIKLGEEGRADTFTRLLAKTRTQLAEYLAARERHELPPPQAIEGPMPDDYARFALQTAEEQHLCPLHQVPLRVEHSTRRSEIFAGTIHVKASVWCSVCTPAHVVGYTQAFPDEQVTLGRMATSLADEMARWQEPLEMRSLVMFRWHVADSWQTYDEHTRNWRAAAARVGVLAAPGEDETDERGEAGGAGHE